MESVEDTAWLALMGLRGPKADLPARQREAGRSRSKSATRRKQNGTPARALMALHSDLPPIKPTEEMIDWIIIQAEAQATYFGCERRCKAKDEDSRCDECRAYMDASERFRNLIFTPAWTVSGLPDKAEPPPCLCANPNAQARWVRAWELRLELIARAKRRLGEA